MSRGVQKKSPEPAARSEPITTPPRVDSPQTIPPPRPTPSAGRLWRWMLILWLLAFAMLGAYEIFKLAQKLLFGSGEASE